MKINNNNNLEIMKYAEEIKQILSDMATNLNEEMKSDTIEKVKHFLKTQFTKEMRNRATITFDPTIKECSYKQYTDMMVLVIPKMYYYSMVKWCEDNGFRVHIMASETKYLNLPHRMDATIEL